MTSLPHSHLARPPHKEPPAHAPNAALLIDFDNVTMGIRSDLQTELKRLLQSEIIRGKVAVQRAYADWRRYPQYIVPLSESSIDLIFAPAYGSNKKNATDIRLAIDALELVFTRPEIGTFILLSGDSDFSSLVLKLKEYGKYVIGVGIRESSSDLLIQNCDEYYSYNELAGLTRTTDMQYERRDPWQLVIEAVKQMTAHNDVMRSDRLKQVMQELDPNFDEKDVGYSRFSKFVLEAQKRGLITLSRLDNGQYEIALGPESGGAPAAAPAAGAPERAPRSRPARGERSERGERPEKAATGSRRSGFSLGEAFGLLKQALGRVGGAEPVAAEDLREAMVELKGEDGESLTPAKFPRLLRQAHDAAIIDLSKEEDGGYQVRLRAEAGEGAPADTRVPESAPSGPVGAEPPAGPVRSPRFRRGSRGPRQAPPPEVTSLGVVEVEPGFRPPAEPPAPPFHAPALEAETPAADDAMPPPDAGEMPHPRDGRSIRGRRGSRGRGPARPAGADAIAAEPRAPQGGPRGDRQPREDRPPRDDRPARDDRPPRDDRVPRGEGRGRGGDRERAGEGDRSRGRRRGGRGRGGREGREGREGLEGRENRAREGRDGRGPYDRGPIERAGPPPSAAPETGSPPPPPPRPRESTPDVDGESFWTRVKRGLIGE